MYNKRKGEREGERDEGRGGGREGEREVVVEGEGERMNDGEGV